MGIFTPVKRHANRFRYVPRYYDPEKERREQRRREMYGTSSQDDGEYVPGQYIRTQREARRAAKGDDGRRGGKRHPMMLLVMLALLLLFAYMIVPRIIEGFNTARTTPEERQQQEYEEFNPYTPITIVPNDYKEVEE
jgi:hypothetical protein